MKIKKHCYHVVFYYCKRPSTWILHRNIIWIKKTLELFSFTFNYKCLEKYLEVALFAGVNMSMMRNVNYRMPLDFFLDTNQCYSCQQWVSNPWPPSYLVVVFTSRLVCILTIQPLRTAYGYCIFKIVQIKTIRWKFKNISDTFHKFWRIFPPDSIFLNCRTVRFEKDKNDKNGKLWPTDKITDYIVLLWSVASDKYWIQNNASGCETYMFA